MQIFGLSLIELVGFIIIFGIATARVSRLIMNEESFLYTGYIARHIAGMRYHRALPADKLPEGTTEEDMPEVLSLRKTIELHLNNGLRFYQLRADSYIGKILSCIWCTSYWFAIFATYGFLIVTKPLASITFLDIWWGLWIASAVSQVASFVYRKV